MGKTRDSANLVSDNNIFVDIVNDRVGIGSTLPSTKLSVAGTISATSFSGDGSNLTGIAVGVGTEDSINTTGIITASSFYGDGSNLTGTDAGLGTDYSINTTGIITASSFYGDGSNLSNITSGVGIATAGGTVGTGVTLLDFRGVGISTVTVSSGISTINIRGIRVEQNSKTASYTLTIGDVGKHISITTGGVTIPSGVFSAGDVISVYNNSGSDQTITQGTSTTLRNAGTADTGNRTLAQYGLCTILCVASNTFVISGAGLS